MKEKQTTPKISVIIPIYNVEKYLHQCLNSVMNQTLKDIEIICIEDCSTDNSAKILKEYARKDSRIVPIFHEKNRGCVVTRRDGVRKSKGEYILFLDGDDFLAGTACEKLYKKIKEKKVDILHFGSTVVAGEDIDEYSSNAVQQHLVPYYEEIKANHSGDITNACYKEKKFAFTLWNKLINGDVVRHAFKYCMDEWLNLGDDAYVFFLISFFANSYFGIPENYHFYNFGAGMTGAPKSTTDYQFAQKNKRGLIIKDLGNFCKSMDPANRVEDALDALETLFIQDVNSNLFYWGDTADKSIAFKDELSSYNTAKVVAEFYYSFQYLPWDKQRCFLRDLLPQKIFTNRTEKVKTLGLMYHRMNNGGVERVLSILLQSWVDAGYKIVLFTDEVPNPQDYDYPSEVVRIALPKVDTNDKDTIKDRVEYLQSMLDKYSVDLMLYHAWIAPSIFIDMIAVKSLGIPFVVNNHGYLYYDLKSMYAYASHHNLMLTQWYRFFDGIVVLSEVDYQWLKIKHNKVYKILNPLTFNIKNIATADLKKNYDLLWVGRISPEKKLPSALNILKSVIDKGYDTKLHVVGEAYDNNYHNVILDEIKRLDLQEHVVLHGFHSDTSKFYKKAGILLMTSDFEGFSMVIAESKAYGIPTVLYDLPNLEFVRDGRGMIVVPQNNIQMAADAIIKLLKDDKLRESYGKEARTSIEDMYSVDVAQKWQDIFDDVIANKDKENEKSNGALSTAIDLLTDFVDMGIESRLRDLEYWINMKTQPASAPAPVPAPTPAPIIIQEDYKEKVLDMYKNGEIGLRYIRKYFRAWLKHKFKRKK